MRGLKRIRRTVRIGVLPDIASPLTFGIFRPIIVLPKSFLKMEPRKLSYILSHEYNHIRQWDCLWNLCMLTVTCAHWFNPFAWVALRFYRRDVERLCDERVLSRLSADQKLQYAQTLLDAARLSKKTHPLLPAAFNGQSLKERIQTAALYQKKTVCIFLLSAVMILCMLTVFTTKAIQPGSPDTAQERTADATYPTVEETNKSEKDTTLPLVSPDTTAPPASFPEESTSPTTPAAPPKIESMEIRNKKKGTSIPTGSNYSYSCLLNNHQYDLSLSVQIFPENADSSVIIWSSENPAVAQVDQNGVVTMTGEGDTVIRATASNGVSASFTLSPFQFRTENIPDVFSNAVYFQNQKIGDTLTIPAQTSGSQLFAVCFLVPYPLFDDTYFNSSFITLENASFEWESSDPGSIVVDQTGNLTVMQQGKSAVITVRSTNPIGNPFIQQITVVSQKTPN